jgi:hypothetical protein
VRLADLVNRWESRLAEWARLGIIVDGAKIATEIVTELAALSDANADEPLTLTAAAREYEMNPDSLGRAIRQGRLPNVGRPNAPRVLRRDVESLSRRRRRKRTVDSSEASGASLRAITRDALASRLPRIERG